MPTVSAIVAFDENRVMGKGNSLPWHLPDDLKHFKKTTLGFPLVMGRKTWDSLGRKPLPRRLNVVVSQSEHEFEGALAATSIQEAIGFCGESAEIFLIGGRTIYQQALDGRVVDRLIVSHVGGTHEGDVYFPHIPEYLVLTDAEYPKYESFEVKEYRRVGG